MDKETEAHMENIREAFAQAFNAAIDTLGIGALKRTSMFGSNQRRVHQAR